MDPRIRPNPMMERVADRTYDPLLWLGGTIRCRAD